MQKAPEKVSYFDGASILRDPLPELLIREGFQTMSSAWHDIYYLGELRPWHMMKEAKAWTASNLLKKQPLSVNVESIMKYAGYIHHEHYLCGDEQSICGRFAQNALGPASAVAIHNGINFRFGDHKVCIESQNPGNKRHIPDHVAVDCSARTPDELEMLLTEPNMAVVGEAKTPWKHDLCEYVSRYKKGQDTHLRRALGQIASYMYRYQMRYGFLTTYNDTIFLQQDRGSDGKSRLLFSPPINAFSSPNNDDDNVSVRQCLYYILSVINQTNQREMENTFKEEDWTGPLYKLPSYGELTPVTKMTKPSHEALQMTPMGMQPLQSSAPLALVKNGLAFEATISFQARHIHEQKRGEKLVEINGKSIEVIIFDDKSNKSLSTALKPDARKGDGNSSQRTVAFSDSRGENPKPSKGGGGLFSNRSAKDSSRLEEPSSLAMSEAPLESQAEGGNQD
ncbi:uncharacterized protein GIQ15_05403 [Arthroderma uncinatum]|uniref:uncharacterized protein n=1 Tax=Arthroderma uncinatum TaxID=74035 RepID=UPI00144A70DD|nr:uncharacterized protein GIQ15_05403 [Arthroderma uncinatum]KAF3480056.1 hypothetical protein GIQ15_05403 [Arthroderma uncinatum]